MKRIGILRGGTGDSYHVSIRKGGEILSHVAEKLSDKWKAHDILVDREGVWHMGGVPVQPADIMHRVDVVWNTAHPSLSVILKNLSIPHVGPELFHHSLSESREMMRGQMKRIGLDMPRAIVLPFYQEDFDGPREPYVLKKAKEIHQKFGAPWMVRSYTEDKNMGIHLAKTFPQLVDAIEDGVKHGKSIVVEEFIPGKIASVHSVPKFRGEDIYTFPLGNTFGVFSNEEKESLIRFTKELRRHLGIRHYLKSDFVLNPRGKVYLLQIESTPNLKSDSHFSEACEHAGTRIEHVVEHILERSLDL